MGHFVAPIDPSTAYGVAAGSEAGPKMRGIAAAKRVHHARLPRPAPAASKTSPPQWARDMEMGFGRHSTSWSGERATRRRKETRKEV